jgi:hypothetical protein
MPFNHVKYNVLLCSHHHHPSPELFSSCKTKALYPLNNLHGKYWSIADCFYGNGNDPENWGGGRTVMYKGKMSVLVTCVLSIKGQYWNLAELEPWLKQKHCPLIFKSTFPCPLFLEKPTLHNVYWLYFS